MALLWHCLIIFKISSSTKVEVSSLQFLTALPSKYLFWIDSKAIISNLSVIPYTVTILLADWVALSISFEAPVETMLKTTSSAALPPSITVIWFNISSLETRYFSSSGSCIVYPKAPMVLGTIVILWTGSVPSNNPATRAWPTSWNATIFLSCLERILSFFSLPAIITSTASSKSSWITSSLPCLTALIAASFIILARSAPTAPGVPLAIESKSTSSANLTSLLWTFKIAFLPIRSGLSTITLLSNLPGLSNALSNISGLFVAPRITIPFVASNPSISVNNWFKVCSLSSLDCIWLSLLLPIESISSIKIIHGACFSASLNKSLTLAAPIPTNISTKFEPDIEKNGTFASPATALAIRVLPVPGGPTNNAPLGNLAPMLAYFAGLFKKSIISVKLSFASSCPATSSKVTFTSVSTYIFALLFPMFIGPAPNFPPIFLNRNLNKKNISNIGAM